MINLSVLSLFKYSNSTLFLIIITCLLFFDIICAIAAKYLINKGKLNKKLLVAHISFATLTYCLIAWAFFIKQWETNPYTFDKVYYIAGSIFSIYFSKIVFIAIALIIAFVLKIPFKLGIGIFKKIPYILAIFVFTALIYGIRIGRFNFETQHHRVFIENLPTSFNNYIIVQVSDLHLGIFPNYESELELIVEIVNSQNPDLVVLTGDLINSFAQEYSPFVQMLQKINAPFKFAVLGNHDYGDYYKWPNVEEKNKNHLLLLSEIKNSGFTLLNNSHIALKQNSDSIFLAGIENWGKLPYRQEGDLNEALKGITQEQVCILLAHDPVIWDNVVAEHKNVKLCLSGHTHGMQIGFRLFGYEFSPLAIGKKYVKGMYRKNNQVLYINKGIGGALYPGRVGIRPEISVLELIGPN